MKKLFNQQSKKNFSQYFISDNFSNVKKVIKKEVSKISDKKFNRNQWQNYQTRVKV